ncbi:MAG: 5-oxoprolinase subunit PxpB [Rhodanobacter sp.]|nr:MAG: 5-oxoprolinase subunit PxpB [Rhodanobacter sp.]TAL95810.1 MAG: 5-oxoprolinase subunit PxpB [Rhodanobacter sp.]TAM42584.1 MAG: 5-oxoprolinase subunit PxpB [Rhodanobacter sp.]TAN26241.1 MAG: 5-oxoprolinase subunit PxpB [Rhodanobacter sp.]
MQTDSIQFEPLAEDALLLRLGERVDAATNARVHAAVAILRHQLPSLECVPAYASVLLRFDPLTWCNANNADPHRALERAARVALDAGETVHQTSRAQEIPVCYGGAYGPDLVEVARHLDLSIDAVINQHAAADYHVAMLGFAPGFPYLLGLDPALAMPRRNDPRQRVPAGSVAIGGAQTGIYPDELPGGWQLIGRTPLRLFDVTATPPSRLAAGDHVRFRAIDEDEFHQLKAGQHR